MIIYTYGHEYPVTSVQKSTDTYDCYICSDNVNGGFCRILSLKDKAVFPELVGWLTQVVDPTVFTDYIEHFMFEDTLCIVMKYTQGVSLAEKSDTESMPLKERLELCRRILERTVLLDIPDYFLEKCFDVNNIIVAPDLTVNFNYPIEDIIWQRDGAPLKKAEMFLRQIFANEIERKVPDELIAFFGDFSELAGSNMTELYSRYYMMMNRLVEREAGEEEPKSIWYRIWDKIKKIWLRIKKVLMFILLAIAVFYLVYSIQTSGPSIKRQNNFDSIGTLTIEKNK